FPARRSSGLGVGGGDQGRGADAQLRRRSEKGGVRTWSGEPDARGRSGGYGGRFVPETLVPAIESLEEAWRQAREAGDFQNRLAGLLRDYVGRPTPLYEATRL